MDIDSEHLGIPDSEYQAIVRMPSSEFSRICKDLSSIGDTGKLDLPARFVSFCCYMLSAPVLTCIAGRCAVIISVTKEGVKFSTAGDIGTANIVCRQNKTVDKVYLLMSLPLVYLKLLSL
jgi:proliferating cell nuclear antigen